MDKNKSFGLIIPQKRSKVNLSNSIFDDDSDDEKSGTKFPKIPQKKLEPKKKIKTEATEDLSIYEYDSIYDDMKAKQAENIAPKEKKQSRYIDTLLKAADKRKKEYERRVEKKIQLEREKEGDKYKDKEAFVTSAYKKKMQEMEEEEERERRENMLNDMMDVTKQKDLSGFYRHFLKQTVGEEKIPTFRADNIKKEIVSDKEEDTASVKLDGTVNDSGNIDRDSDGIEIDDSDDEYSDKSKEKNLENDSVNLSRENVDENDKKSQELHKNKCRQYRSNKNSNVLEKNSSSTSDSDNELEEEVLDGVNKQIKENDNGTNKVSDIHVNIIDKTDESTKDKISDRTEFNRQNIFAKRTIGDVFSAAQARYFQRMAVKNGIS